MNPAADRKNSEIISQFCRAELKGRFFLFVGARIFCRKQRINERRSGRFAVY